MSTNDALTSAGRARFVQELTAAESWELLCWEERVKNAQIVLGMSEGERLQAQHRIAAAHGVDLARPYRFLEGRILQDSSSES